MIGFADKYTDEFADRANFKNRAKEVIDIVHKKLIICLTAMANL